MNRKTQVEKEVGRKSWLEPQAVALIKKLSEDRIANFYTLPLTERVSFSVAPKDVQDANQKILSELLYEAPDYKTASERLKGLSGKIEQAEEAFSKGGHSPSLSPAYGKVVKELFPEHMSTGNALVFETAHNHLLALREGIMELQICFHAIDQMRKQRNYKINLAQGKLAPVGAKLWREEKQSTALNVSPLSAEAIALMKMPVYRAIASMHETYYPNEKEGDITFPNIDMVHHVTDNVLNDVLTLNANDPQQIKRDIGEVLEILRKEHLRGKLNEKELRLMERYHDPEIKYVGHNAYGVSRMMLREGLNVLNELVPVALEAQSAAPMRKIAK